jgi:hypothetical protein
MDMVLFVGWTARTVIWLTDDTALAQSLSNSRAESHWVPWRLHNGSEDAAMATDKSPT